MIAELIATSCVVIAWAGHTPDSKAFAEDIDAAIKDCGLQQKDVAIDMGIDPKTFSKQLAGVMPMNALRLYGMTSPAFRLALLKRQIKRLGADVLSQADREFAIACAVNGKRKMARILPSIFADERRVS